MNYIIFDLEWNQPADETLMVRDPFPLPGEIIQLGAVKLNDRFEAVDELRLYIAPHFYPKLHKHVASLTGISDRVLKENGIPFPDAYARFSDWCGDECTWMTWSTSDLPILLDNLLIHGLDVENLPDYCDVQRIFSREIMRSNTQYAQDSALAVLKEKGDTAHDALHDARNCAKICNHLDLEAYMAEYTGRIFAEHPSTTQYQNRQEMLADPSLSQFSCPWCGSPTVCEPWIPFGHHTLAAYGICPQEDEFLVHLLPATHPRGEYTAKRILYELTDDLWDIYLDKKEAAQGVMP